VRFLYADTCESREKKKGKKRRGRRDLDIAMPSARRLRPGKKGEREKREGGGSECRHLQLSAEKRRKKGEIEGQI